MNTITGFILFNEGKCLNVCRPTQPGARIHDPGTFIKGMRRTEIGASAQNIVTSQEL